MRYEALSKTVPASGFLANPLAVCFAFEPPLAVDDVLFAVHRLAEVLEVPAALVTMGRIRKRHHESDAIVAYAGYDPAIIAGV